MSLTAQQRETLLRPIKANRVLKAQGQSHLPAYDVEAHLTRMFGFEGWDREILELWLIHETKERDERRNRDGWTVTYGCKLRLTVRDPHGNVVKITDGVATGSANNLPDRGEAHDFAIKNADSYALKRAAKSWGDQFGLSLYNKGMTAALVKACVAYGDEEPEAPTPESMGNDEREAPTDDSHATNLPPEPMETLSGVPEHDSTTGELSAPITRSEPSDASFSPFPQFDRGPDARMVSDSQRPRLFGLARKVGIDPKGVAQVAGQLIDRQIESVRQLTYEEADWLISRWTEAGE